MDGPGKYDDVASDARFVTDARALVLVVVGGNHGNGFAVQVAGIGPHPHSEAAEVTLIMAASLRHAADEMERDAKRILSGELQPSRSEP